MIHLHVRSAFSFLAGGSPPEALVARAAELGQPALALTDLNGVYGAVRFARACQGAGVRPLFGATLKIQAPGGPESGELLVMLAENRIGYARLCALLSRLHQSPQQVLPHQALGGDNTGLVVLTGGMEGSLARLLEARRVAEARQWLGFLQECFPGSLYLELVHTGSCGDGERLRRLARLAQECELLAVVSNAVRFARPQDLACYDALTCVRLGLTVGDFHPERPRNDHGHLCSAQELSPWFQQAFVGFDYAWLEAVERTHEVAARCHLDLLPGEVTPPTALLPPGLEPDTYLRRCCQEGLAQRYPSERRERAWRQLDYELTVVSELELAEFFLVVREVTEFARRSGIRYAGRGSAANSIIAYVLGITTVDPLAHRLLFERFLHRGRKGMPDIDVDFDSERRSEVIAWMEQRFGAAHCAMTATISTYQLKGAMREMMKVLGWDLAAVDRVCQLVGHWDSLAGLQARRSELKRALTGGEGGECPMLDVLLALVERVLGLPRHLGLHNGGMVLTREPLDLYSPIQTSAGGFREIQFDKDDVESMGLIKFDCLGLRMLSVLSEACKLHRLDTGQEIGLDALSLDDEPTYALIRSGQTMSLFQIESPGQMSLLSRTQPRDFRDLVAQVALFRPGPLQGGMVHPYVQRRLGALPVTYLHPVLESILEDTYGIILFQEQVLEICHQFAGLTLEQADEFRRLMSRWRDPGNMESMRVQFVNSARQHHEVGEDVANEVFRQVSAFVGYGFCRSHAAAFARTVYHSAYLKAHYPAAYMAAVMEHKPGFYPMSTVLEEARHLGVRILGVCVWRSQAQYRLEQGAIRVPLSQVQGFSRESAQYLVDHRPPWTGRGAHDLDRMLRELPEISLDQWESLARAGAFGRAMERREALWRVGLLRPGGGRTSALERPVASPGERAGPRGVHHPRSVRPRPGRARAVQPSLFGWPPGDALVPELAPVSSPLQLTWDYATVGFSPDCHPLRFHRSALAGTEWIGRLKELTPGQKVAVAGLVLVRQKPPTAKGMVFFMIEDETGRLQVAVTPPVFQRLQPVLLSSGGLWVQGILEGSGSYRSLMVEEARNLEHVTGRPLFARE